MTHMQSPPPLCFTKCVKVKILLVLYPVVCNKMTWVGSFSPHHVSSTIWLVTVICQWYKCLHVDNFPLLDISHVVCPLWLFILYLPTAGDVPYKNLNNEFFCVRV